MIRLYFWRGNWRNLAGIDGMTKAGGV